MAICGWCGTRGLDPNRPADNPQPHRSPRNGPCRGYVTWLSRNTTSVKGVAPRG